MPLINRKDWKKYPTIDSLFTEFDLRAQQIVSRMGELTALAQKPFTAPQTELLSMVSECVSLVDQITEQVAQVTDASIDIPQWLVYLSALDTTVRLWYKLPAFYGTGDDFDNLLPRGGWEYIVRQNDTWESIERITGVPWPQIAQQNRLAATVESDADWVGRVLYIPAERSSVRPVPGVLGSQSGPRVLGRDLANSLSLETQELDPVAYCTLTTSIDAASTAPLVVDSLADIPDEGYIRIGAELLYYKGTESDLTCQIGTESLLRGQRSTQAAAHSMGSLIGIVPLVTGIAVLDYTDTFIQGMTNLLEDSTVDIVLGGDYGQAKQGIALVTLMTVLKEDPRVDYITNVEATPGPDATVVRFDVVSVGHLATHTLKTHYHGAK